MKERGIKGQDEEGQGSRKMGWRVKGEREIKEE